MVLPEDPVLEQESCLSPQILLPYSFSLTSATSNNTAEYESLIIGLELAFDMRIDPLIVYGTADHPQAKKDDWPVIMKMAQLQPLTR